MNYAHAIEVGIFLGVLFCLPVVGDVVAGLFALCILAIPALALAAIMYGFGWMFDINYANVPWWAWVLLALGTFNAIWAYRRYFF